MNSRPRSASTLSRAPPSASESLSAKRPPSARVRSARDSSDSHQNCPLADPSLGLVSMTDHQNRRCLCRFCTCGEHKCPGEVHLSPYPKAMFTSQYQEHHSTKTPIKALIPVRKAHRENVNPMELLSQYELAFRPFRVAVADQSSQEKNSKRRPQSAGPQPRFIASSTNKVEYPSWGETHPFFVKRYYDPVPTQDLAFHGYSEYEKQFPQRDMKAAASKAVGANDHSSLALHGDSIKLQAKTTARTEFRVRPGAQRAQSCKKSERLLDLSAALGTYQTEYSKNFVQQTPLVKNPQDVRRYLLARETA